MNINYSVGKVVNQQTFDKINQNLAGYDPKHSIVKLEKMDNGNYKPYVIHCNRLMRIIYSIKWLFWKPEVFKIHNVALVTIQFIEKNIDYYKARPKENQPKIISLYPLAKLNSQHTKLEGFYNQLVSAEQLQLVKDEGEKILQNAR